MAQPFSSLTLYRLREQIDGESIKKFEDFIDPDKRVTSLSLTSRYEFDARLFIAQPDEGPPSWIEPLENGFGNLKQVPDSVSNSAVLVIRPRGEKRAMHFAATFGFGRFLLRAGSVERNYGMRVALNAIYPGRKGRRLTSDRLRSVDSKTVGANTLRTRRQVDRLADFETFDVDVERDLLSGLTGTPLDTDVWGSRIDGSDALHLHRSIPFNELGKVCLQVEKHSTKVPREFAWVDKIFAVRDSSIIQDLKERIVEAIKSERLGNLDLAPPELIEWGDIDHFGFSFDADNIFNEPTIEEYVEALRRHNKLDALKYSQVTSGHRLVAMDATGNLAGSWPVFKCLTGELERRSPRYIISEGDFFEVTADYMSELDGALSKLHKFGALPHSGSNWSEDRYNKEASKAHSTLLLDKKTIHLTSRTTPIEICDILTSRKDLIHVKRKLNSSSLSHLFSQGLVSADLLLMSEEFRKKASQRIKPLENARRLGPRFSRLFPTGKGITARDFTVVYAIIAKWKGKTLAQALPFFSKVNLRRCAHDLRRMGYGVAYEQILEIP